MSDNIIFAFALTLFAGLATGIGSLIALFAKHTNKGFLSFSLGLSAGVMIYVSFVEILFQAKIEAEMVLGGRMGEMVVALAFFGGMLFAGLIDKVIPQAQNPHETRLVEDLDNEHIKKSQMSRMGIITAVTIAIHNFPEGIATFMTAVESPEVGVAIAAAVAIHNIPEGIAVSVPIYYATKSHKKAFWYSLLSGLSEPVGAIVAYLILAPFMTPLMLSCILAGTAGIMIFISVDELLPAAQRYGKHHISIYGMVAGMAIMAVSLILLK